MTKHFFFLANVSPYLLILVTMKHRPTRASRTQVGFHSNVSAMFCSIQFRSIWREQECVYCASQQWGLFVSLPFTLS